MGQHIFSSIHINGSCFNVSTHLDQRRIMMNNPTLKILFFVVAAFLITIDANATLTDGLIAHWALDGNAIDATGNLHDGVIYGVTPTTDRFDNPNSAYAFDGNDYIAVPDSPDFTLGSNSFTIAAWSKISAYSSDGGYYLMGHDNGPGTTNKWILFQGNSSISFIATTPGWVGLGSYDFNPGDWHHIAVQRDGNTLNAFIDGTQIGSASFTYSIPDPSVSLLLGDAESQHDGRNYRGSLDDVRIYSLALSLDEIQELSAVPIPGAAWLLGSGLICLVGLRRRKIQ